MEGLVNAKLLEVRDVHDFCLSVYVLILQIKGLVNSKLFEVGDVHGLCLSVYVINLESFRLAGFFIID